LLDTLSKEELINRIIDQHAHRIMSIHGDAQNLNETYNPDQANYGSDRRGGEYRGGGRSGGGYRGGDRGGRRFDRGGGYGRRSGGFRNDRGGHGGFRRDASAPSREISISR
jgi:hypothetical protein